jgi:hypothetical protein
MPYVNKPRPYKHEYQMQLKRGEIADKLERQRARRAIDKTGVDRDNDGKADRREGKDVDHIKMLRDGGSNKDGVRIISARKNRARNGHSVREPGGKKPA